MCVKESTIPSLPPRPCTTPRCAKYATKGGKCEDHQPEPWQSSKGKTPAQRGYGAAWVRLRGKILKRDDYLCQVCLANGILTEAKEVDHILNKKRGGTDQHSNLQAICKKCHKAKTLRERNE